MATVKHRPDPSRPETLSESERARLDAMDDAAITQAAADDPDNPPLNETERNRAALARAAKRARAKVGLSQRAFAERYRIGHARLRDLEQGRGRRADSALLAYLTVIEHAPDTVARALETA
jgi:putative transcriptional regulator